MVYNLLEKELKTQSISDIKIHLKVESLVKDDPVKSIDNLSVRAIMW